VSSSPAPSQAGLDRTGSSPAVEVVDLAKTYRPAAGPVTVFDGLALRIAAGELAAVMGPSGAGKSTLLHLIGGLDAPDRGSVRIFDTDLATLPSDSRADFRNRQIGFVFQFHFLLPEFTALENVMIPAMIAGRGRREAEVLARQEIEAVGLTARARHRPSELSGGEQQRVAVARALVMRPKLLLADEPTGNLDSRTAAGVLDVIEALHRQEGLTTIIVTHNEALASRCSRVLRLQDGALSEAIR